MRYIVKASTFLALLLLAVLHGVAQTTSGTINGTVVDRSGGAVPGARVTLINQQTGVAVKTKSRGHGEFVFPGLQPGTFSITVDAPNYKQLRKVSLVLDASQVLSAGVLTLDVGNQSETVTVTAEAPIQLDSSERSDVLDEKQIGNLLTQGRDVMALLTTMPGVVSGGEANTLGVSTTPYVNGVNNEYNMATVDGVSANTRGYAVMDTPLNLDAIKEVTVEAANYQAQYGKTAGSSINLVTKSGTRNFHGSIYYYGRNEAFNANSYFNKRNALPRPRYRYNTAGATLGGPVFWPKHFNKAKDKLFFFVSVEDDPNQSPEGIKYYVVPTALERKGDFSQSYNQSTSAQNASTLIRIKDPSSPAGTCAVNSATPGTGCFADNMIPSASINSAGVALLNVFPMPNMNNLVISGGRYNYVTDTVAYTPVNQEIFRIDYFPTQRLHMFVRGDLEAVNDNGFNSPTDPAPWGLRVNYRTTNPNFVFNTTYAFSSTILNELNLGTSGWSEAQLYNQADLAPLQQSTSGYNLGSLYPGNNPLNVVPSMTFGGISGAASIAWNTRFPIADQVRDFSATDNVTWILGRHNLKAGVDGQTDAYLQKEKTGIGNLAFSRDTSNPYDSNYAYANAVLGNFDSYAEVTKLNDFDPRTFTLEWYTQDQWKIRRSLTLDYGIRYSYDMSQHLAYGANFLPSLYQPGAAPVLYRPTPAKTAIDPTTGLATYPAAYSGLFIPGTGNLGNGALSVNTPGYPQGTYYGNGLLLAPRVGFAWDPYGRGRTVVRAGYGIFYNVRPRTAQAGGMYANPPATFKPQQYYGSLNSFKQVAGLLGPSSVGWALPLHPAEVSTMNMSLGVQQILAKGVTLDLAYVGTLGRHVSDFRNINEVPYGSEFALQNQSPAGGVLPDNFFRPYLGYATINLQSFDVTSNYNAFQMKVTRRFANSLSFGLAYTFSKAMDYSDALNGTVAVYQPLRAWDYGPAAWDRRNNLTVNYVWSLPKIAHAWSNKVTRSVFNNWQLSGIDSYISGSPGSFSLSVSNGANITGGGDGARLMLSGDPMARAPHTFTKWFDTTVVQVPVAGQAATSAKDAVQGQRGNAPRVNFYNPGHGNFNTALFKNIPLHDRTLLQFRIESYNTLNHSEFNSVDGAAVFANASSSTTPETSAGFGQIDGTAQPRYLQLALRINF